MIGKLLCISFLLMESLKCASNFENVKIDPLEAIHKNVELKPIRRHHHVRGLMMNNSFSNIENGSYFDVRGDNNCLFYSFLYLLYNELRDNNSEISQRFFSLDDFVKAKYSAREAERIENSYANAIDLISQKSNFRYLLHRECHALAIYFRYRVHAYLSAHPEEQDYLSVKGEEMRNLIDMNDFKQVETSFVIIIGNMLNIRVQYYVTNTASMLNRYQYYLENDNCNNINSKKKIHIIWDGGHFNPVDRL